MTLAGPPPEMPLLKRGADPYCARTPMRSEEVVSRDGALANVAIRVLGTLPAPAGSPAEPLVIQQEDCIYRPRVAAVAAGTPIRVVNGDKTFHNVRVMSDGRVLLNRAQVAGAQPFDFKPAASGGLLKFKCDVHPWMTAYVVVHQNAFTAVSSADGRFSISGLPPGEHTVEAWHERYGARSAKVTVESEKTASLSFAFP